MRKYRLLIILAGIPFGLGIAAGVDHKPSKEPIAWPSPMGMFKAYSFHCRDANRCDGNCKPPETLMGGGCSVEETHEGRAPPSLQSSRVIQQENTGQLQFSCTFQSPAKVIITQVICLERAVISPAPVTPAPPPGSK